MPEIIITEKALPKPITTPANLELPEIAWQGSFADYRDLVSETTEAADVFHYATFCQVLGCTRGRRLYVYHATNQYPNFYICLVGRSGLTRKDTCVSRARDLLLRLHDEYSDDPTFRIVRGIRSFEGLLDELSGEFKVRLIQFGELYSLFAKAKSDSTGFMIPSLTEIWDCPDRFNPPVRGKAADCRKPFVSIIAGTTQAWLRKSLTEGDIYGGFANRWLYFFGLPKGPNSNPPKVDSNKRDERVSKINDIRLWAENVTDGEITISYEASQLFDSYYREYYQRVQFEGIIPTLIVRIQDYVWKLALLYAAMDHSESIKFEHIEPAIAVGDYFEKSITEIFSNFGESKSKESESKVLEYLKNAGQPIDYRLIYKNLNMSAKELDLCVEPLIKLGVIKNTYRAGKTGKKVRMLEVF